jgi:hypothetical protein
MFNAKKKRNNNATRWLAAAAVNSQSKSVPQGRRNKGSRPRGHGIEPETSWAVRARHSVFQRCGSGTSEKRKSGHLMNKRHECRKYRIGLAPVVAGV